eukprot:8527879-Heterocapsa_arctica.AAC.1
MFPEISRVVVGGLGPSGSIRRINGLCPSPAFPRKSRFALWLNPGNQGLPLRPPPAQSSVGSIVNGEQQRGSANAQGPTGRKAWPKAPPGAGTAHRARERETGTRTASKSLRKSSQIGVRNP